MNAKNLNDRISDYLAYGGLFNPEFMDHDKVRDLLMDTQQFLLQYADINNEMTEEWITQFVDQNIEHDVKYENDSQWWEEYQKSPQHIEAMENTRLMRGWTIMIDKALSNWFNKITKDDIYGVKLTEDGKDVVVSLKSGEKFSMKLEAFHLWNKTQVGW